MSATFDTWIKRSVITTPEGAPLRVYHGTSRQMPHMGKLTHFGTSTAAINRVFQLHGDEDGTKNIFSGFLNITNPMRVPDCWQNSPIGAGGECLFHFVDHVFTRKEICWILSPLHSAHEKSWSLNVRAGTLPPKLPLINLPIIKAFTMIQPEVIQAGMTDDEVVSQFRQKCRGPEYAIKEADFYYSFGAEGAFKMMAHDMRQQLATYRFVLLAQHKGYDGLVYTNTEEGGTSYVTFSPKQIWLDDEHFTFVNPDEGLAHFARKKTPAELGRPYKSGQSFGSNNQPPAPNLR